MRDIKDFKPVIGMVCNMYIFPFLADLAKRSDNDLDDHIIASISDAINKWVNDAT